jgi:hypothetical protein
LNGPTRTSRHAREKLPQQRRKGRRAGSSSFPKASLFLPLVFVSASRGHFLFIFYLFIFHLFLRAKKQASPTQQNITPPKGNLPAGAYSLMSVFLKDRGNKKNSIAGVACIPEE